MPDAPDAATLRLIAGLWTRNRPLILERLAQLDAASADANAGSLSEPARAEAESTAHKLAGSLGMFGFHQGTEIARTIEGELRSTAPDASRLIELAHALRTSLFP